MLIDWVTDVIVKGQRGMSKILDENHILIVNFPSEPRVRQLIEELRSDPVHQKKEIVVVTDQLEKLPFSMPNVSFVRGSPLQQETYELANLEKASMALVLATSYENTSSDAVVASAASVIDSLKPSVHIVAECLEEKHRMLFKSVRCDAIVPGLRIIGNLLVQEVSDPGVARMIDVVTSNLEGDTVYSSRVSEDLPESTYNELAKRWLDEDINLLCVNRGEESHTRYSSLRPQKDDIVVYVAPKRMSWANLRKLK
jgi:voltage-gated potassium channel